MGDPDVAKAAWDGLHGKGSWDALPAGSFTGLAGYEVRDEVTTALGWLKTWGLRAADAREYEPLTSAQIGCVSLKNPNEVLIYERYTRGQKSVQEHFARPAHKVMEEVLTEKKLTRKRLVAGILGEDLWGWVRSPEERSLAQLKSAEAPGPKGTLLFLNVRRFGSEKQLEDWVKLMKDQFQYCWEHEPDTLCYYGGRILKPGERGAPVQKGDMFFVMECSNGAAMKKHSDAPAPYGANMMKTYESTTKADPNAKGITYETILEVTYRTTDAGFMTKHHTAGWIQDESQRGKL